MLGLCVRLFCLPVFLCQGDWCVTGAHAIAMGCFDLLVPLLEMCFSWGVLLMGVGGYQYSGHHRLLDRSHR